MGVANPPEIFHKNMNDLFYGFLFIYAYINAVLVLTKRYWTDNVQKL